MYTCTYKCRKLQSYFKAPQVGFLFPCQNFQCSWFANTICTNQTKYFSWSRNRQSDKRMLATCSLKYLQYREQWTWWSTRVQVKKSSLLYSDLVHRERNSQFFCSPIHLKTILAVWQLPGEFLICSSYVLIPHPRYHTQIWTNN